MDAAIENRMMVGRRILDVRPLRVPMVVKPAVGRPGVGPGRLAAALLIAAGADQVWPSAHMARALSQRLREHGDPHGHMVLEYPKAVTFIRQLGAPT